MYILRRLSKFVDVQYTGHTRPQEVNILFLNEDTNFKYLAPAFNFF